MRQRLYVKHHYLVLTLPEGKEHVRYEYFPLERIEETVTEAVDRWIDVKLGSRQRNRAKVGDRLRASILTARLARPTAWYREQAEKDQRPFPSPPRGSKGVRRRRK